MPVLAGVLAQGLAPVLVLERVQALEQVRASALALGLEQVLAPALELAQALAPVSVLARLQIPDP